MVSRHFGGHTYRSEELSASNGGSVAGLSVRLAQKKMSFVEGLNLGCLKRQSSLPIHREGEACRMAWWLSIESSEHLLLAARGGQTRNSL